MGELRLLDKQAGDLKIIWDSEKPDEVEAVRKQFDELKKKGYMAWNVTNKGRKGDNEIKEFDPDIEKIIMTPAVTKG